MARSFPPVPRRARARRLGAGCALLCLVLGLTGCAGKETAPEPAVTAPPAATAAPLGSAAKGSALSDRLLAHLSPLKALFDALDRNCFSAYGWTVPRDLLEQCARDVSTHHISEEEGMQVCTAVHSSHSSYTASGMDEGLPGLSLATLTPEEMRRDEDGSGSMNTDLMGDFETSGGGEFVRTLSMRLAPDASLGTVSADQTLNGEPSGRESFVFLARGGTLYFYDAALNLTAFDQDGNVLDEGSWLITCGTLSAGSADIVEFVSDSYALPAPESLPAEDLNGLAARPGALRLKVLDGKGRVTRGSETLEEFSID